MISNQNGHSTNTYGTIMRIECLTLGASWGCNFWYLIKMIIAEYHHQSQESLLYANHGGLDECG